MWKSKERRIGALRDSIQAFKSKFENGGYVVSAGNFQAFYAHFVELGTPGTTRIKRKTSWKTIGGQRARIRTRAAQDRTPIPANPFLRKGLEDSKGQIKAIFDEVFGGRFTTG
jgi:HK97 gp10 family phage protein